jgi:hypothetical protein
MLVTSQFSGNRVTGLYIGAQNVQQYFPKNVLAIELQLDHLRIECGLPAHFWEGQPEIHDPRLCLWLELKHSQRKDGRTPMPLDMTPSGEHSFTLGPAKHEVPQKTRRATIVQARPSERSQQSRALVA